MKAWILLTLSLLLAAATTVVTARALSPADARHGDSDTAALGKEIAGLSAQVQELQETQTQLAKRIADVQSAPPAAQRAPAGGVDEAVARWMEANAARVLGETRLAATTPEAASGADADPAGADADLREAPLQAIMAHLGGLDDMIWGDDDYWQKLRDAGRIDEVVAEFERLAALDPGNPDLQVQLGGAYLQQLFGVGSGPQAGQLAMKADTAFDQALSVDDHHWEARFSKAVALSNWPAFLGKTGEAIHQFQVLADQQEASGSTQPEYASTYLFLGNLYQQTGETQKAVEAWQRGLALFPANADLQHQLELGSH